MKSFILPLAAIFASLGLFLSDADAQSQNRAANPARQLTLGPIVPEAQQVSMNDIDHEPWDTLLQKYVNETGVNYKAWHASQEDLNSLDQYIATLSHASARQPADAANQMAYWINAYNAVTIKGIMQEYPTTSIRNFTSETGGYNVWKNLLLNVAGQQISLDSMENQILRPMGDFRIHFAIVCASKGCPPLSNRAFDGECLEDQLAASSKTFFAQAQNFQYDPNQGTMKLSSIIQWFPGDFGADQAAQLRAIAKYLPTEQAQAAANANSVRVSYLDYDWGLNAQPEAEQGSQNRSGSQSKQGSQNRTP